MQVVSVIGAEEIWEIFGIQREKGEDLRCVRRMENWPIAKARFLCNGHGGVGVWPLKAVNEADEIAMQKPPQTLVCRGFCERARNDSNTRPSDP